MQKLLVRAAQQKQWADKQNNLLKMINEEDEKFEQAQGRMSNRRTVRMTMVLSQCDFDQWAQEQGLNLKVQKTLKLKFGFFNKQFVLINRYKENITDNKLREKRREELRDIKSHIFLMWIDELH